MAWKLRVSIRGVGNVKPREYEYENPACKMRAFCVVLTLMNNYLCKFWGEEEGLLKKKFGGRGVIEDSMKTP